MTTHWMGYDVETSGDPHDHALQPWRVAQGTSWVTSTVAIDPVRKTTIEACLGVDPASRISAALRATLEHALAHDLTVVGWNVAFDIQWMIAHGLWDLVRQVRWLDGMLLWKQAVLEQTQTATKRFTFGLKECVRIVLPQHAGYEDGVDFHGMDPETVARRHDYNRRDVAFTLLCARHWWSKLNDRQRNVALIEAASLPQVARANFTGMKVDTLVAREVETHLDKVALIEMTKLRMLGATREKLASPVQLAALIFDEWGLPSTKVTATGRRSTDKEVLTTLALDDPRVAAVLKWRNSVNSMTKFAIAPRAAAEYNGDGMARPQAIIASTYTARFSYASNQRGVGPGKRPGTTKQVKLPIGFALHQMQRGPMFRQEIIAPEGFCVVEFDAAGQEFRWMAIMSNDQVMLRLCRPGEDPHGFMGAQIGHKDYREMVRLVHDGDKTAKSMRQLGKVGNLSCQYRTSPPTLRKVANIQYGLPMTEQEAKHIIDTYRRTYPGVPLYWQNQIAFGRQHGYVENLAGRRVRLHGNWMGRGTGWALESATINWPIQSIGAEQKYLALKQTAPIVHAYGNMFAWDLHDGLYFYARTSTMEKFMVDMKQQLDHLDYEREWGYKPTIPLPFDCKFGPSWGKMQEVKF